MIDPELMALAEPERKPCRTPVQVRATTAGPALRYFLVTLEGAPPVIREVVSRAKLDAALAVESPGVAVSVEALSPAKLLEMVNGEGLPPGGLKIPARARSLARAFDRRAKEDARLRKLTARHAAGAAEREAAERAREAARQAREAARQAKQEAKAKEERKRRREAAKLAREAEAEAIRASKAVARASAVIAATSLKAAQAELLAGLPVDGEGPGRAPWED